MKMGPTLGLVVGGLLFLVGALWTLQGLDYVGGSSMSGDTTWATIGPLVALAGIVLGVVVVRRNSR